MRKTNCMAILLSGCLVVSSCGSMSNTAKGGLIGGGSGAALGAIIGGIAGHGKGAAIGAAVGAAVGTGAGVLIGKKMDKAAEQAAAIEGAQVEQVVDNNGLQAVKVTFDSGILYNTGSAELSSGAKASLSKFANNVLKLNADMDVDIYGYTDNQGWRNSTAAESQQKNLNLSQERAQSVSSYLMQCGAASSQIKTVQGKGEADPVADNATEAGRKENRRVEVYMYASQAMIQQAEAGTLQ
ncbi:MAG: OmpA family protein [Phocaeicola plebeius]|nr:OmpA family protein [Phocaeicola plebeius]